MTPTRTPALALLLIAARAWKCPRPGPWCRRQQRDHPQHRHRQRSPRTAAGLQGQSTQQTIAIGGVSGKVSANDVNATANVVGAIAQTTTGASRQNIGIGSVQGNVEARNVTVNGTAIGAITQNGLGRIDQRIGIGSVQGTVTARNITATGITGGLISQTGTGTSVTDKQLILVGRRQRCRRPQPHGHGCGGWPWSPRRAIGAIGRHQRPAAAGGQHQRFAGAQRHHQRGRARLRDAVGRQRPGRGKTSR